MLRSVQGPVRHHGIQGGNEAWADGPDVLLRAAEPGEAERDTGRIEGSEQPLPEVVVVGASLLEKSRNKPDRKRVDSAGY